MTTTLTDLSFSTATALASAIRQKHVSATEVLEAQAELLGGANFLPQLHSGFRTKNYR